MKKQSLLLSFLLLLMAVISDGAYAQISQGGLPPSFEYPNVLRQTREHFIAPVTFDVNKLIQEDRERESLGVALRTAVLIPAGIDLAGKGEWTLLPDGRQILRLTVDAPGAIATMLYYDEFYIPEGGKLFIYNADRTQVLGAYTKETNPSGSLFATEFVSGDQLTLEYVAANYLKTTENQVFPGDKPRIIISNIGYGYNYLDVYDTRNRLRVGESGDCMVNINCEEGADWQVQKTGVAKTITPSGNYVYYCSGTMINNTAMDLTPYYLTASHCMYDIYDNLFTEANLAQAIYYFHFEHPGCDNLTIYPESTRTLVGAELKVNLPINGSSDGALLELATAPPSEWGVYYNGWDRRNTPLTSGVGIHHPHNDVKKISTVSAPAQDASWNGSDGSVGYPNAHWNVIFVATPNGHGVTESGSSGSPLFNQEGRVVGTLSGGNSSCTNPGGRNLYGKLWYHWDQGTQKMNAYLDPLNTGAEILDGTYVVGNGASAAFSATSTNIYALESITYKDLSDKATSWQWTFEGGTPSTHSGQNPPVITYNTPGSYTTTLTINEGTADENTATKQIEVSIKGNPVPPVAQFSFYQNILMTEGFDAGLPPGWTNDAEGVSGNKFIFTNMNNDAINFNTIDPESQYSALVQWDADNEIDAWLRSTEYEIPDHARLEFYALYQGTYITGGVLSVYITTDNWNTSTEVWTNGPDNTGVDQLLWYKNEVDLSEYAGQTIKLGFRYKGIDGYFGGFDGVKIYAPKDAATPTTIEVGDYITPIEYSTGPVVLWEWTFPGGTPETSTERSPKIQYTAGGTYDITLKVTNTEGSDTRTFENAVIVTESLPQADYSTNIGYTRRQNWGLFIPEGTKVDFTDLSLNYPTSWQWTFDGGDPSSSTEQNPKGVTFNTEGEFNFGLKAINAAGSNEILIEKGTKVGFSQDTVWNMAYGEGADGLYSYTYGYVTGTNSYMITSYAEKFDAPLAPATITGVKLNILALGATSSHNLLVGIAKQTASGLPGALIATTTLAVADINQASLTDNNPILVEFTEPIPVNEPFFIVAGDPMHSRGSFYNPGYTAAIATTETRGSGEKNTSYWYDYYYQEWEALTDVLNDFAVSMDMAPVLTYALFEIDGDKIYTRKNVDSTITTISLKTNIDWIASSDASWINITDGRGTGNGSFTFTVDDNPMHIARKALIKISGGGEEYILVQQAGNNPSELTATISNEENGTVDLNWNSPEFRLIDGAEDHPAFAINSRSYLGWSYIDGEGDETYGLGQFEYENKYQPMAFQVFDVSKSGISLVEANSGNKFFASFASVNMPNDDWMISPVLSFTDSFTFSFWGKSFYDNSYTEVVDVVYSTTGKQASDFTHLLATEYITSPDQWNLYTYTVPAEATYVAIHCKSNDQYILMIDDIFIGLGEAPQSVYDLDPTLNANPFAGQGTLEKTRLPKTTLPIAGGYSETDPEIKLNTAGKGVSETLILTNEVNGKTIEVIKAAKSTEKKPVTKLRLQNETGISSRTGSTDPLRNEESDLIELRFDSGVNYNAIGSDVAGTMETAIRFTMEDLYHHHGAKMKAVQVYINQAPVDGITLKIRKGTEIIHTQPVSASEFVVGDFSLIELTNEIKVDMYEDLYVGYEFDFNANTFPAGVDAGPAVAGKGDLISEDGGPFENMSDFGLNYNWNIALFVEDITSVNTVAYRVYHNGELLATTNNLAHTHRIADNTPTCYQVSAHYNAEAESVLSNEACVENVAYRITLPVINGVVYDKNTVAERSVRPGQDFSFTVLEEDSGEPLFNLKVTTQSGHAVETVDASTGSYIIRNVTSDLTVQLSFTPACILSIPQITGIITDPAAGDHRVPKFSRQSLTITPETGYTIEHMIVKVNGQIVYDATESNTENTIEVRSGENSIVVDLGNINSDLVIEIEGVTSSVPTGIETITGTKIYTLPGYLVIELNSEAALLHTDVRIYSITGSLVVQRNILEGTTRIPLSKGTYLVVIGDKVMKVIL